MMDQPTNKYAYVGWMPMPHVTQDYRTAIPCIGNQPNTNSPYSVGMDSTSKTPPKRGYQLRTADQPTIFVDINKPAK